MNEVIAGGLSADIMDYLLRDSYFTGVEYGKVDIHRVIDSLEVMGDHLVLNQAALYAFEALLIARYEMFKAVYFHRTVRAAELMLAHSMTLADEELGLTNISKIDSYLKLTDEIVVYRLSSLRPDNQKLRLARRLAENYNNRRLVKCVFEKVMQRKDRVVEKIPAARSAPAIPSAAARPATPRHTAARRENPCRHQMREPQQRQQHHRDHRRIGQRLAGEGDDAAGADQHQRCEARRIGMLRPERARHAGREPERGQYEQGCHQPCPPFADAEEVPAGMDEPEQKLGDGPIVDRQALPGPPGIRQQSAVDGDQRRTRDQPAGNQQEPDETGPELRPGKSRAHRRTRGGVLIRDDSNGHGGQL